jgi:hypothetical protein
MIKIVLIITLLFCSIVSRAQPFTLDKKFKPVQLKLHKFNPLKEPKAKGSISITEVMQKEDTLFYFVKGASIYCPIYVGLQSGDSANSTIDISLHKLSWKRAERSGTTDATGHWEQQFKTENDFGIQVIVKEKPTVYSLMVWVGDEVKMELPTVFKKGTIPKGGNFFKDNLLYLIIGGLVMILLILFIKFKKKSK